MILGLSVQVFTQIHVAISLVAILSGLLAVLAMVGRRNLPACTALFLATTVLTSVTGFFFHSAKFGPPHVVGLISLAALVIAIYALYVKAAQGRWRVAYIVTVVLSLYLNCFVGVVQAFQKIPAMNALAPNGNEPAFLVAQVALMGIFLVLGFLALQRFHPAPKPTA